MQPHGALGLRSSAVLRSAATAGQASRRRPALLLRRSAGTVPAAAATRAAAAAASGAQSATAGAATAATVRLEPAQTAAAAASAAAVAYDAAGMADTWARRPVPVVARLGEIAAAFSGWWLRAAFHGDESRAAADMREVLVGLGPAFVKIGQALSSRPDVLPPAYLTELELLQDRIPAFPDEEAVQVIEGELGLPLAAIFSELSASPVAAASLGQVYRGRLAATGEEVAVKVQRPGVVEAIGRDTFILRHLAALARRQLKLNTDLPALVDEWAASLFKELDYRREAANAERFSRLFSFMPEVMVPRMFREVTTPRVLVMEWVEGERLRSAGQQQADASAAAAAAAASSGSRARQQQQQQQPLAASKSRAQVAEDLRLVEIGVRCSLEQMLEDGFYHADPHPGNLLKTADGRLAYLDFGMMGEIEPSVRQALIRATLHLVNREYEALAGDFVALGLLPAGSDMGPIIPALTGVFQTALAGGVSNLSFGSLSTDLGKTMYKFSFRIPPYYTLLVRSLSVLEGIALASDPNYKVLGAAYPWVARRLLTQDSPELTETLNNLLYDGQGHFRFDRLESLLEQAAKAAVAAPQPAAAAAAAAASPAGPAASGSNSSPAAAASPPPPAAAVQPGSFGSLADLVWGPGASQQAEQVFASLLPPGFDASSLLLNPAALLLPRAAAVPRVVSGRGSEAAAAGGPLALVLSPEGRYIRSILEEELAKGLDAAWRLGLDNVTDAAAQQLQGAVGLASALPAPLSAVLLPPWLQQQVRQHAAAQHGLAGAASGSSSVPGQSQTLLETLLHMPKLAAEEDREQVDGLQRLAVQLAAFSTAKQQQQQWQQLPAGAAAAPATATAANGSQPMAVAGAAGPLQLSPEQAARLEQLQQTARVLQWLASEVQLLSPAARREALSIPFNILSKLGSRLAARAVKAVLTPTAAVGSSSSSSSVARTSGVGTGRIAALPAPAAAAGAAAAPVAVAAVPAASSGSSAEVAVAAQQQQPAKPLPKQVKQVKQVKQRLLVYTPPAGADEAGTGSSSSGGGSGSSGGWTVPAAADTAGARSSSWFDEPSPQQQQEAKLYSSIHSSNYGNGSGSSNAGNGSNGSSPRAAAGNGWQQQQQWQQQAEVVEADVIVEPLEVVLKR